MLLFNAVPAFAVPASKLQQARTVKKQIDQLDHRMEVAAERYNEAASKHAKLVKQEAAAKKKLKKVKKRMGVVQEHLSTRANSMYREGPMGFVDVLLGAESFDEFASTWDLLQGLNESDATSVAELKVLRAEAKKAAAELDKKEKAAKKQKAVMKANKASIQSKLSERKSKLRGLKAEIRALEAAEEAARARASAPRSRAAGRRWPTPSIPAHGSVVAYAKSRLGCPYVWAASGPNRFDCSGLTMWCYRQIGIRLPHSSRAQINVGQRVSRSDLRPGDLVFFGSPIHHVGMYVGGGRMIHAPHSGDVVRYASINRSDYAGASRP